MNRFTTRELSACLTSKPWHTRSVNRFSRCRSASGDLLEGFHVEGDEPPDADGGPEEGEEEAVAFGPGGGAGEEFSAEFTGDQGGKEVPEGDKGEHVVDADEGRAFVLLEAGDEDRREHEQCPEPHGYGEEAAGADGRALAEALADDEEWGGEGEADEDGVVEDDEVVEVEVDQFRLVGAFDRREDAEANGDTGGEKEEAADGEGVTAR